MKNVLILVSIALLAQSASAYHVYANYECSNSKLELKYDGPGSNYAVGGYAHFYVKNEVDSKKVAVLAIEASNEGTLGETIADEVLGAIFEFTEDLVVSEVKTSIQPGDACIPGELDYQHSEWLSKKTVELKEVTAQAANQLGLGADQVINFDCSETRDEPVICPESGKHY